jgi:N-acylneuraminate cytidylyltransferase/CMP-N,N'-diacetyllegionaminic acid synthase
MENENGKILAVIPARGGSKGLPGKNIIPLNGKPLIYWTIKAAQDARCVDRIFVSTDDRRIADTAKQFNAEVPWLRPPELADDASSVIDAVKYDVTRFRDRENYNPEYILLLQPTSPLRTGKDIDGAFALLKEKNAGAVVSVTECSTHPYIMKVLDAGKKVHDFMAIPLDAKKMNRQNFPQVHALNVALYLIKTELFLKNETFLVSDATVGYEMPPERSVDIDTGFDLITASALMSGMNGINERK